MLGPRVGAERRVELDLGGEGGRGGETFSFLDARCKTGCTIEKKHMLPVAWATWGGSFAPWGAAAPQTPPCSWRGSRPTDSHGWGAAAPPSQHVFLFDRASGFAPCVKKAESFTTPSLPPTPKFQLHTSLRTNTRT